MSTIIKIIAVIALPIYVLFLSYSAGEQAVQSKWDLEKVKVEKEIAELKAKQSSATVKVITKYVSKVEKTTVHGKKINDAVVRYVSKSADTGCIIPNNAITLFDASVSGQPLPEIEEETQK